MKIAIAQVNTTAADVEGNARKIEAFLERAHRTGAELVVFPELAVPGYAPLDYLRYAEFVQRNEAALQRIADSARGIKAVVGHVSRGAEPGAAPCNSASLIGDGRRIATHHKVILPCRGPFPQSAYFAPGPEPKPMDALGLRVGVTISDDLFGCQAPDRKLQENGPVKILQEAGVDILINLAAFPYRMGQRNARERTLQQAARQCGVPLVFANLVGGNDSLVFDGASVALDSRGTIVAAARRFEEDLIVFEVGESAATAPQQQTDDMEELYEALKLGLRDYARKCGFSSAVLGLSGGIDSSLVAAIAAEALGPESVVALIMPSVFSTSQSLEDAKAVAENLGITCHQISIEPIREAFARALSPVIGDTAVDVTQENIQARIRGSLLMAFSNKFGYLPLTTGNRSELAVGYCTLYGDMAGAVAVIGDVPKTTVYRLVEYVNRKKSVIPESVILKPPSAELRPGQTDQDELPPYEVLDEVLRLYLDERKSEQEIVAAGFERELVLDVERRVARSEFKRRQAPLVLRVISQDPASPLALPIAGARLRR